MQLEKAIMDYLNEISFYYLWMFFIFFEIVVYYFMDTELSLLFAILMIPIWMHDILLTIFKGKK
jgi:hypothetical protein